MEIRDTKRERARRFLSYGALMLSLSLAILLLALSVISRMNS